MTHKQQSHLDALSRKHRELDRQISSLQESANFDDMELVRLKHEKLKVKDEIFAFKRKLAKDILSGKE